MSSGELDMSVPNVARIYDYLLGGKDNFEIDRQAAQRLLAAAPETALTVRENRAFLRRAVRDLAEDGIRQFIDIGAGLPTQTNVHEVVQKVSPDARVVYLDNDPVVVTHGRALLTGSTGVTVAQGDLRRPEEIMADPVVRNLIDPAEPVAVLLLAVLHFVRDEDDPAGIVRRLREAMAPGSVLVLTHVTSEGNRDEAADTAKNIYDRSSAAIALRSRDEIAALFEGFELLDPGLVFAPDWRPDAPGSPIEGGSSFLFAGVGRLG